MKSDETQISREVVISHLSVIGDLSVEHVQGRMYVEDTCDGRYYHARPVNHRFKYSVRIRMIKTKGILVIVTKYIICQASFYFISFLLFSHYVELHSFSFSLTSRPPSLPHHSFKILHQNKLKINMQSMQITPYNIEP